MAGYSIISDVSGGLLKTLRRDLCPEPIQSPESIQLASPADKNADFQLGLYLYDFKELGECRVSAQTQRPGNLRQFPPRPLTLSYLLFLNSKAQIVAGADVEQRVLGRALQTLSDNPSVELSKLHSFQDSADADAAITFLSLSFDDKTKIWSSLSVPYQIAVYFSVAPVLLSSTRSESFTRVRESTVTLHQREASGGRREGFD